MQINTSTDREKHNDKTPILTNNSKIKKKEERKTPNKNMSMSKSVRNLNSQQSIDISVKPSKVS